jgi:hypothetical protein
MNLGAFGNGTYTENGDTVTVKLESFGEEGTMILTKSGDMACRVESITGVVGDPTVTDVVLDARVFTKVVVG